MNGKRNTLAALSLVTLALTGFAPGAARAEQGVSLSTGLTDFTTWQMFGTASAANDTPGNGFTYSILTLTPRNVGSSAGAAFAPTALSLDFNQNFSFDFNFYIQGDGLRGDGLTFTLTDTPGVGGTGSDLGYGGGSSASVALAVDTFNFTGDPETPALQILQGGSNDPGTAYTLTGLGSDIQNSTYQLYASLAFVASGLNDNAGVLTGTLRYFYDDPNAPGILSQEFTVSSDVDFAALGMDGSPIYYGFTASNGAASDGHFVATAEATPVPLPPSAWLLLSGVAAMALVTRRRALAAV